MIKMRKISVTDYDFHVKIPDHLPLPQDLGIAYQTPWWTGPCELKFFKVVRDKRTEETDLPDVQKRWEFVGEEWIL